MTIPAIDHLARIHKAIGTRANLRLLGMLLSGPICTHKLKVILEVPEWDVSRHLHELHRAGLVTRDFGVRCTKYRLVDDPEVAAVLSTIWPSLASDPQVMADSVVLHELRRVTVEDLCEVNFDLRRIARPPLARALARAETLRAAARETHDHNAERR